MQSGQYTGVGAGDGVHLYSEQSQGMYTIKLQGYFWLRISQGENCLFGQNLGEIVNLQRDI